MNMPDWRMRAGPDVKVSDWRMNVFRAKKTAWRAVATMGAFSGLMKHHKHLSTQPHVQVRVQAPSSRVRRAQGAGRGAARALLLLLPPCAPGPPVAPGHGPAAARAPPPMLRAAGIVLSAAVAACQGGCACSHGSLLTQRVRPPTVPLVL